MQDAQYLRKVSLVVSDGAVGVDLSAMHFKFSTAQADVESPNNCSIRIYNLSDDMVRKIRSEFSKVTLNAGYESNFGVIFTGNIKQYRVGRENSTDTYMDILAADGDMGYNFGVVNTTLAAGVSAETRRSTIISSMPGLSAGTASLSSTGGVLPRGKVLFGMARDALRNEVQSVGATWNIVDGKVNITALDGYLPGTAVVLNSRTGLIGLPEQTAEGLKAKCLLNPRLGIGTRVQIDNAAINQTVQANQAAAPIAYNSWTNLQFLANISADGMYRLFVVEHEGDTRGQAWYSNITALAVSQSTDKVKPYG